MEANVTNRALDHGDGEIWHLSSCPTRHDVIATSYSSIVGEDQSELTYGAALWQLPTSVIGDGADEEVDDEGNFVPRVGASQAPSIFTRLLDISESGNEGEDDDVSTEVSSVLWNPVDSKQIATLAEHSLCVWDLNAGKRTTNYTPFGAEEVRSSKQKPLTAGKWVGSHGHSSGMEVAVVAGRSIMGFDLRSSQTTFHIPHAHDMRARDVDFNPNLPNYFISGGDDGALKFWDSRNTTQAVRTMRCHSHWIWAVRYNHFHDQLVLTSGSDCAVVLSSVASLSSEMTDRLTTHESMDSVDSTHDQIDLRPEPPSDKIVDGVVRKFDEHEDSVYAVDWSAADPWLFASLSLDGRVVVNHVPRDTKYGILL
ncbi:hypothetical protein SARC_02582 [Sphaeroforma arctica JP610]|uniref:EIPR1-like beta-propeller domain-containing protein n=1 Tax=Sphaeroforma arctica JP610 TaxID=667725 RepID=A0A0L0G8H0_9EUKA|nr:hypothetical protein SARC_02582 [Sphaeroforma arctica JP610]KNC85204.1 hypothetical protein SARC_02582 [Sphaeroforma arctica JP610]|eukprot:XP_014159106.1 hypothetical protein SARC_02582 [Sphaeroforma arctica JP610]